MRGGPPGAVEAGQAREWLRTAGGVGLAFAGELAFTALDQRFFGWTLLPILRLAHASALAVVLAMLLTTRAATTRAGNVLAGLCAVLPLFPIFWLASDVALRHGGNIDPLGGYRLALIATALLMPGPLWLAGLLCALLAGSAAVHLWLEPALFGARELLGEPWMSAFHLAVAGAVLLLRARVRRLEEEDIARRSAVESARVVGRVRRALGDGAFTPLQTIEANAFLLEKSHPEERARVERTLRATRRIRELLELLHAEESPAPELSVDPRRELSTFLRSLRTQRRRSLAR